MLKGRDGKGELAWKVDVKAQLAGWAITLRNAEGLPCKSSRSPVMPEIILAAADSPEIAKCSCLVVHAFTPKGCSSSMQGSANIVSNEILAWAIS